MNYEDKLFTGLFISSFGAVLSLIIIGFNNAPPFTENNLLFVISFLILGLGIGMMVDW